jgi:hypothetical protein
MIYKAPCPPNGVKFRPTDRFAIILGHAGLTMREWAVLDTVSDAAWIEHTNDRSLVKRHGLLTSEDAG